jgi:pyridoxal phosphate enzyme (YggS family)
MTRRDEISDSLHAIQDEIAHLVSQSGRQDDVTLIVVTKTYPVSDLEILYELGVRDFGENRVQEAEGKVDHLPHDIRWHYQGQIQSNKLASITSWAHTIHSFDEIKHFTKAVDLIATNPDSPTRNLLMQINMDAPEERSGRAGVVPEECENFLSDAIFSTRMPDGVMAVASPHRDAGPQFSQLVDLSHYLQTKQRIGSIISAGMSGDFSQAILAGATHIRVGSSILGKRPTAN